MAIALNYNFDKVHLKRGVYAPKGHMDYILHQEFIRRALVNVFLGKLPIPIKVLNVDETQEKQENNIDSPKTEKT